MRRLGGIWPRVVGFDNLLLAYRKARRGKGRSPDVAQYFPSIDHAILKSKLRRRIKDARVLELLDRIIDTSPEIAQAPVYYPGDDLLSPLQRRRGIPIGNLTSQFLANLYLDDIEPSIQSWIGHAMHADTERLRAKIISAIVFRRGTGREAVGVWCAGAPGTTNRRTSARPTATGPPPTTGTTTSVFVSPSPPARPNGRARSRSV